MKAVTPRVFPGVPVSSVLSPFIKPLSTVRLRRLISRRVTFSAAPGPESSSSELGKWGASGTRLRRGVDFFARPGDCLPGDLPGDGGASVARWRALRWFSFLINISRFLSVILPTVTSNIDNSWRNCWSSTKLESAIFLKRYCCSSIVWMLRTTHHDFWKIAQLTQMPTASGKQFQVICSSTNNVD